jgi:hypothetical protein
MSKLFMSAAVATLVAAATQTATFAGTPHGPPFQFGGTARHGPYTVTIDSQGDVTATGNGGLSRIGVTHLGPTQDAALNADARAAHFGSLPAMTHCSNAQANSTTWVRIASKKVSVHGACLPAYQHLFNALVKSVNFYSSG